MRRYEGTPQGGPLSPLLANLLLDDLDKMLEARGHRFRGYADDVNIYVRSRAAGERVMAKVAEFLHSRLHLKVNRKKSAVAPVGERSFLGHRLLPDGSPGIAPESLARAKQRIRRITRRNRGISLARMISELDSFLAGWVTYFRHARGTCNASMPGPVASRGVSGSSTANVPRPKRTSCKASVCLNGGHGYWPSAAKAGGAKPSATKPPRP